ncbi:MAG TPA: hypothetical protein VGC24_00010, partial [Burkholderiaceae bacterium]
ARVPNSGQDRRHVLVFDLAAPVIPFRAKLQRLKSIVKRLPDLLRRQTNAVTFHAPSSGHYAYQRTVNTTPQASGLRLNIVAIVRWSMDLLMAPQLERTND